MPSDPPQGWYPRRGEVYLARLDKLRPGLVISVDELNRHALDVCVVPVSTPAHRQFARVRVPIRSGDGGLEHDSWARCDQVTTIPKSRLQFPPLGTLSDAVLHAVEDSVRLVLGLI